MTYLQYCKTILFSLSLWCIIFVSIVLLQIGIPTSGQSLWINELYTIKSSIAKSIKTPKLVIVSGSSALFGISCEMIHKETQVPCLNAATHAGLGIKYIFHRAHSLVNPRDTVILPLEYAHYKSNNIPGNVLVDYVIEHDPKYLISADLAHSIRIITGISFNKIAEKITYKLKSPKVIKTPYQSKNINEFGDETGNLQSERTEKQLENLTELKPDENIANYIKTSNGLQTIKNFISWCNTNNIKVIATWPNTVWFDVYKEQQQQDFFQSIKDFYEELKVPILGSPENFMYDKSMFYDSRYHLNDVGVRLRNQQLINLLEPFLNNNKSSK
ncbi:MAG: hypothetical protein HC836_40410 [Richelia sp. RM2_1_2]|nr:hypothetical protein [Richelia sp. RM1_1_1]NJO30111.1 hypothetical protein [Richelia sp. SL_2_1]NJO64217.1 hypothetical protein [Richelia sp. RM2_1_2]